ncbi:hypothetical protein COCON_G00174410 [Conger conger]|uniref:VWFC domain-containing protein n=1 Tax=Conger conger TaxID=82655 RepID=A0A9Q1D4G1_CONCO|nr:hypothetical protein COCON_G00174410 [Conger conger]
MRAGVVLALSLLLLLGLGLAQEAERGRRRRGGQKRGRNRSLRQNSEALARLRSVPLDGGDDDDASVFIESYKNVNELESSYSVIPGRKGQCMYQGITMFDRAVWSPKPCLTCLCSNGLVACDEVSCPRLRCPRTVIPVGECCPVCSVLVPDGPELSGDSSELNDPGQPLPEPHTQEHMDRLLRREEEAQREEEARLRLLDAERRRKRRQKKLLAKQQKELFEERRREEEALREQMEKEEEEEEQRKRDEEAAAATAERERQQRMEEERRREEDRRRTQEAEQRRLLREPPAPAPSLPVGCVFADVTVTCKDAHFTNIPPLFIPQLKALSLEGNDITTIPTGAFNGLPKLEWINLSKNRITASGIDPQVFKGLKFLTRLYMDSNFLDQIPPELPPSLQELKINENNLRGIDENSMQSLQNLVTLELEGNMLSEGNVAPEALQALTQLSYLRLGRNHFRTVPQGLPAALQELHLENNVIEEISESVFNNSRNLNIVVLRHNRLDETMIAPLAWINHKHLESIDLSHNKLYHVPSFLPRSLVHLVLVGNRIERIPGYVFAHMDPGIEYLYLSFNKLESDGVDPLSFFGSLSSMSELFLDHNQLTSVPLAISEMKALRFLRLNDNNMRSVAEDAFCDPMSEEESNLMTLRLENNFIDTRSISPTAFSCIHSYLSVVLQPQKTK